MQRTRKGIRKDMSLLLLKIENAQVSCDFILKVQTLGLSAAGLELKVHNF